jgi:hypothetical protein
MSGISDRTAPLVHIDLLRGAGGMTKINQTGGSNDSPGRYPAAVVLTRDYPDIDSPGPCVYPPFRSIPPGGTAMRQCTTLAPHKLLFVSTLLAGLSLAGCGQDAAQTQAPAPAVETGSIRPA